MTIKPLPLIGAVIFALVALGPPLEPLTEELFSAHMVQHMIFVLAVAPLIVASGALAGRVPRILRSASVAFAAHALALWTWHLPDFYDAAVDSLPLHLIEHLSFLGTAILFWNVVLDASRDRLKRVALVFGTALQSGALGVVIAFAGSVVYSSHIASAPDWDMTPIEDQQLAGAIMWVPPGIVYLCVMLMLLARALSASDAVEQP
jgi:cytochrome c oxidase assembly factor CtaG